MDQVEEFKKERDHDYIARLINEYFSQKLFNIVGEVFVRKEDRDQELLEVQAEGAREAEDDEGEESHDIDDGEAVNDPGANAQHVGENKYLK
jgi:hypothetical protein